MTNTSSAALEPMDLEDHLFFLCTQVVHRRERAMQQALAPLGLAATEYRVLSAVLRKGPLSMYELAQWTAYERTRLTHMLDAMQAKRWIGRSSANGDRRSVIVSGRAAGLRIFQKAKALVDELTEEIMSNNDPADLARIRAALRTMRGKLIEMGL